MAISPDYLEGQRPQNREAALLVKHLLARRPERLSQIILTLHSGNVMAVEWEEKKEKK